VVFGRVVSGSDVVSLVENQPVDRAFRPLQDARITNSGELVLKLKTKSKYCFSCNSTRLLSEAGWYQPLCLVEKEI